MSADPKELLLAKLLQNAWSRKLGWCRGASYKDKQGGSTIAEDAVSCCAMGAACLEEDTDKQTDRGSFAFGWVEGNDSLKDDWDSDYENCEDVGYAFKMAMTTSDSDPIS
jgi:hypothetical protein